MAFKLPQFGSGKASTATKKPATRQVSASKPVTVKKSGTVSTGTRKGGVGYRQAHGSKLPSAVVLAIR